MAAKTFSRGKEQTERRAWNKNKRYLPISTTNRNPMKMRYDMAKNVLLRCSEKRMRSEMAGNIGEARIKARCVREGVVSSAAKQRCVTGMRRCRELARLGLFCHVAKFVGGNCARASNVKKTTIESMACRNKKCLPARRLSSQLARPNNMSYCMCTDAA